MHTQGGAHTSKHTHTLFLSHWWLWAQFRKLELGFEKNSRFNVRKTVVCPLPCWRSFSRARVASQEIHLEAFCGAQRTHVKTFRSSLLFPAFQSVCVYAHNSINEGIGDIPLWIFNMQAKLTHRNARTCLHRGGRKWSDARHSLYHVCGLYFFVYCCYFQIWSALHQDKTTNSWRVLSKKVSFY